MRILFIVIILAALGVGGYAVYKEEYVIAQVVNLLGAKKRKKR